MLWYTYESSGKMVIVMYLKMCEVDVENQMMVIETSWKKYCCRKPDVLKMKVYVHVPSLSDNLDLFSQMEFEKCLLQTYRFLQLLSFASCAGCSGDKKVH